MGVYIKGMEMPKGCLHCSFSDEFGDCCCKDTEPYECEFNNHERRPDWCPLIEVPPHGRLIDADAATRQGWAISRTYSASPTENVYEWKAIDSLPVVIEAEDEK